MENIPEDKQIYIKASLIQHKTVKKDFDKWMVERINHDDPNAEGEFPEYKIIIQKDDAEMSITN